MSIGGGGGAAGRALLFALQQQLRQATSVMHVMSGASKFDWDACKLDVGWSQPQQEDEAWLRNCFCGFV